MFPEPPSTFAGGSNSRPGGGGTGGDLDFDELARRFDQLKKNNKELCVRAQKILPLFRSSRLDVISKAVRVHAPCTINTTTILYQCYLFAMAASKAVKFTYNNSVVNWMRKFAWNYLWGGREYGLQFHDTYYEPAPEVTEALRRLNLKEPHLFDQRKMRLSHAHTLALHGERLPKDKWTQWEQVDLSVLELMSAGSPHWAKDSAEEDRVETLIRGTGCWDQHLAVVDCMGDKGDWRQCQEQVQQFKECMTKKKQPVEKNMLSDLFINLEIDEDESNKVRGQQCAPDNYIAENHSVGWFLNEQSSKERKPDESREILAYRAAYYCHHRDFKKAFNEYTALFTEYKHSRTHAVAVVDSLVRCALKIPSFPVEVLLSYLHEYEQYALDYGDQLQYLNMKKDVYAVICRPDASQIFVDTVCLLCVSVDLPEHWLAFGRRRSLTVGQNFYIGFITRAILLLERHLKHAHGFVSHVLNKKLLNLRGRLEESESPERIEEAQHKMGFDMVSCDDNVESNEKIFRPHDSRSKVEVYKSAEECKLMVEHFQCKFSWMFEGCIF
ncbi:hypothetical protein GCK32_011413 [Trichostrongylus colubriformis]|uniref:Cytochrome b-c1 complex subunit 7 n=1 Tax=Trichostrongylus colubriformis TaxID=6319 RepID=A0AAN8G4N3_TRICO